MESVEAVVIGAGVVGLACARALAIMGKEVIVIEQNDSFGMGTSSRNSEVIHAGIYYPKDSLKATLCVEGNRKLYAFCEKYGVSFQRCGKLIVATSEEQYGKLESIFRAGKENGVPGLSMLSARETKSLEPNLSCVAAIYSSETGIIDSHGLMAAMLGDAERLGTVLAVQSTVVNGHVTRGAIQLVVQGVEEKTVLQCAVLVNAAGLFAPKVAASLEGMPLGKIPSSYLAKGNYYALQGRAPFSRLIYPVPEPGGLGVHLTLDLGGGARFGPDVEWIDELDYSVEPSRADKFYSEVRRYWPGLADGALTPAFCGIRPKISGPDEMAADFLIQGPAVHGIPGLVNLFGIESPGLTSSLAIADHVVSLLEN